MKNHTRRHIFSGGGRDTVREAAVEAGAVLLAAVMIAVFPFVSPGHAADGGITDTDAGTSPAPAESTPSPPTEAPVPPFPIPTETGAPDTDTAEPDAPGSDPDTPLPTEPAGADSTGEGEVPSAVPVFGSAVASPHAILIDLSEGRTIRERAADERINPASLTKIMTLIVVREHLTDLSAVFVVPREIPAHTALTGGSNVGLEAGEVVTVKDLIYAMMLPSACDAAECLACCVAGSEENFAELMNEKAAQFGLRDTHFVNASGISAKEHYSTVRELSVILTHALSDEFISSVMCTESYTMAATEFHAARRIKSSMFRLTETYTGSRTMRGATLLGGKTGTGANQWRCLASVAFGDDGKYYILVTCGATSTRQLIDDTYFIYSNYC